MTDQPAERSASTPYRVLARKYRPARFDDLIGQEALVRTLTNAIQGGRLAHAFILTGVRGVGKTTTARIIARALNCVGSDGTGGPTPAPCGACEHCRAISQDRHQDVIEMDAASRTGVGDIRELIEGVRYRPVQARYKIYIIDEVHMLSTSAFNALLKTLEEPPEHVIFIFATTEIRKVPVTVLSRCQRFDLRRVAEEVLSAHFADIAEREGVTASAEALSMIARAADGSVRDGLSLLDQAMALGGGTVEAGAVRDMLGLADRAQVFDLFDAVMAGEAPKALSLLQELYSAGADPAVVLQDLLELTHLLTRGKLVPRTLESQPEIERVRGGDMAVKLSLPVLARTWQILLKGLGEARSAPAPLQAAEMVLIRLAYASELPSPADLVKSLQGSAAPAGSPVPRGGPTEVPPAPRDAPASAAGSPALAVSAPRQDPRADASEPELRLASFEDVVALARDCREMSLANHLMKDLHLVSFEVGRIEVRPAEGASAKLAGQLAKFLQDRTGERWMVTVSQEDGEATLHDRAAAKESAKRAAAMEHPLVQATLRSFPGAKLIDRRERPGGPAEATGDEPRRAEEGEDPS
jgi:DNA polymerase-3 subunit gamma/tau